MTEWQWIWVSLVSVVAVGIEAWLVKPGKNLPPDPVEPVVSNISIHDFTTDQDWPKPVPIVSGQELIEGYLNLDETEF